jgi:hypothetical protein
MISSNATPKSNQRKAPPLLPYSRNKVSVNYLKEDGNFEPLTLGQKIVVKDSWPLVEKATQEIEILKKNSAKWGIAEFYGGYEVSSPEDPIARPSVGARFGNKPDHDEIMKELQEEAEDMGTPISVPLNRSGDDSGSKTIRPHDPFSRQCVRLLFKSFGLPLTEAPNNFVIIQSILDAVIG